VLGRRLEELFPIAFLPSDHALAVAIMSYDGRMSFGLLGDYDAMPDLDAFGEFLESSLAELTAAARARTAATEPPPPERPASAGKAARRKPAEPRAAT